MPIQKRAIEKRNRIIKYGFRLMCTKGYYKVNTADIAKYAGVSTGIVYQYFNDKKEIFIEGIKKYANSIMFPLIDILDNNKVNVASINELFERMINELIKSHTLSKKAHEEMTAMAHLDEDIGKIFNKSNLESTNKVVTFLKENGFNQENLNEKVNIIMMLIDNFCHEIVYNKNTTINSDIMKKEILNIINNILK